MMDISGLQGKDSDACIRVLALPRCITRGSIVCKEMQRVCTNLDEVSSKRAESAKAAASPMHPNASDSIQRARTTFQIHKTNNVKRHKAPGGFKVWVFFKYIYTYMLNLTSCMVPLCPAHPTRNMPLPGWLAADSPFQPARKRPWLEPSPPGTVLLPARGSRGPEDDRK